MQQGAQLLTLWTCRTPLVLAPAHLKLLEDVSQVQNICHREWQAWTCSPGTWLHLASKFEVFYFVVVNGRQARTVCKEDCSAEDLALESELRRQTAATSDINLLNICSTTYHF